MTACRDGVWGKTVIFLVYKYTINQWQSLHNRFRSRSKMKPKIHIAFLLMIGKPYKHPGYADFSLILISFFVALYGNYARAVNSDCEESASRSDKSHCVPAIFTHEDKQYVCLYGKSFPITCHPQSVWSK